MKVSCKHIMYFDYHISPFSGMRSLEGWQGIYQRGSYLKVSLFMIFQMEKKSSCQRFHSFVWATLGVIHSLSHGKTSSGKCHHNLISHVPSVSCEEDPYAFEGLIQ